MHHENILSEEMRSAAGDLAAAVKVAELEQARKNLEELADKQGLGPTGNFPDGKLTENDEGEIRISVGGLNGSVVINFGRPIASIGFSPAQALNVSRSLREAANKIQHAAFEQQRKAKRAAKR